MDTWFQFSLEIPSDLVDLVSGVLFDLDSCGQQVEDGADIRHVRLTAFFPSTVDREEVTATLRRGLKDLDTADCHRNEDLKTIPIRVEEVPWEDWTTSWRQHFRPVFPTRRIAVCPPWDRVPDPEGGFSIVIEPKQAFGTGHHETTRLVLRALERVLQEGDRVLDVGAGSGILSIAAIKLGAGRATAVDTDPVAIENSLENLLLNGVEKRVEAYRGSVRDVEGVFDLVVANITSGVLLPMLPALKGGTADSGHLVLGGILDREEPMFVRAVEGVGLAVEDVLCEGEWVCVVAEPLP